MPGGGRGAEGRGGGGYIDYRLDRLGIPLIEIATGPDFTDPQTPADAALAIGRILRATGKVKRGIGTIRQDVNVSIKRGARQEIKGVQELSLIPSVIEREVQRQLALLEIGDELRRREAKPVEKDFVDVTGALSESSSRVIRGAIEGGGKVLAVRLEKFGGLIGKELQPGRRFGTELADYAKLYGGVGGIFHTDELPGQGISAGEVEGLRNSLKTREDDAIIFVAGKEDDAEAALEAVVDRANQALEGVPEETRRALPDGNTEFMRPLPGAARMYVETDISPIAIPKRKVRQIKKRLPELPERRQKRFQREYGLSEEFARRMSISENVGLFEELVKRYKVDPTLVASTLEETLVSLRREGVQVDKVEEGDLAELFNLISKERLAKEAVPEVLKEVAKGATVKRAISQLGLARMSKSELKRIISQVLEEKRKLVEERGEAALDPLMGVVMENVRARADGRTVHELLKQELKKRVG